MPKKLYMMTFEQVLDSFRLTKKITSCSLNIVFNGRNNWFLSKNGEWSEMGPMTLPWAWCRIVWETCGARKAVDSQLHVMQLYFDWV
jgi:hypothetical protein